MKHLNRCLIALFSFVLLSGISVETQHKGKKSKALANKSSIVFFFLFLCTACINQSNRSAETERKSANKDSTSFILKERGALSENIVELSSESVVPDTTIGNRLILRNTSSATKFYPNFSDLKLNDDIGSHPMFVFCNRSKSEYLLAYCYEGDIQNSISCIELGYSKDFVDINAGCSDILAIANPVEDRHFETESGLQLGMTLNELFEIKGSDFEHIANWGNYLVIIYRISGVNKSSFLQRYNMPGYFIEVWMKDQRACKIKFGFDYP